METIQIPVRYVPIKLAKTDKTAQIDMLLKSRKLYKKHKYFTRKRLPSFKSKPSKHVRNARRIYNVENVSPTPELAAKTGCKISALNQNLKKSYDRQFRTYQTTFEL